jgi:vacuole morphology and inheritance protein 14
MTEFQTMAVQWILEFIHLSGTQMLPFTSGILVAILPNLAFDDERRRHLAEDDYRRNIFTF